MKRLIVALIILAVFANLSFAGGQSEKAGSAPAEKKIEWTAGTGSDGLPVVNPLKVSGNIISAGSSTVFPVSEVIAQMFRDEGYKGNVTIDSIGSGAGFERFVKGELDISNASVKISDKTVADAKAAGRVPLEFRLGTDALAVCVAKGSPVTKVSQAQLVKLFSTAEKWSEVDPSWPAQPILRFIPGTDSGTFSYFVEHIFKKKKEPLLAAKNLQLSEDDHVLVQGIAGSPNGIGFFGFAYYVENKDKLQVLSVDGIEPNQETVDKGSYPLARPLFIYTTAKILGEKPQVAAFVAYYLSNVNKALKKVGYFPAPAAELQASKQAWLDVMKGKY